MIDIKSLIPHREPFLFVDEVVELSQEEIVARKVFTDSEDFYSGHYPDHPITPGVILCETVFQTAAILVLKRFKLEEGMQPVLARIEDARFKSIVPPNEPLIIFANLIEKCGQFFIMSGKIVKANDQSLVLKIKFTLALTNA